MAQIIDDTKINTMLGAVNQATSQTTGAISQIEQWNSLAQNINGILEKITTLKAKSGDAQPVQQAQAPVGQIMENKVIPNQPSPITQPQTNLPIPVPTIAIDNIKLKEKIISNFNRLKNLPADLQEKPIKELIALGEQNLALIDAMLPMISAELKECVKWT